MNATVICPDKRKHNIPMDMIRKSSYNYWDALGDIFPTIQCKCRHFYFIDLYNKWSGWNKTTPFKKNKWLKRWLCCKIDPIYFNCTQHVPLNVIPFVISWCQFSLMSLFAKFFHFSASHVGSKCNNLRINHLKNGQHLIQISSMAVTTISHLIHSLMLTTLKVKSLCYAVTHRHNQNCWHRQTTDVKGLSCDYKDDLYILYVNVCKCRAAIIHRVLSIHDFLCVHFPQQICFYCIVSSIVNKWHCIRKR